MQYANEIQWEDILKKTIDRWSCVAATIFVEKEKNTSHADGRRLKSAEERRGFYSYNPKK